MLARNGQAGALSQLEITPEMIDAGADALWSEVDGDYVRLPRSFCSALSESVLRAAMSRAINSSANL